MRAQRVPAGQGFGARSVGVAKFVGAQDHHSQYETMATALLRRRVVSARSS